MKRAVLPHDHHMHLSKNIRYLRKKQGLSQEQLADAFGYINYTTVQKWESGKSDPPIKVIQGIAEMFNVSIGDLIEKDLSHLIAPSASNGGDYYFAHWSEPWMMPQTANDADMNDDFFYTEILKSIDDLEKAAKETFSGEFQKGNLTALYRVRQKIVMLQKGSEK